MAVAAVLPTVVAAQQGPPDAPGHPPDDTKLPNGKSQRDEILKLEYEQNLKDARELSSMAKSFELDLEKNDRFVLSLPLLKRLDDMEKLTKRIRTRMKR